jgi:transposase
MSGIIGKKLIGLFRVSDGLKLSSAMYCPFLKKSLESRLDKLRLATLKKITLMHDNATVTAAKATTQFLQSFGFANEVVMFLQLNSQDLNPIEMF